MNQQKLFNLFAKNRGRGNMRAQGDTIFIYDFIAGSKSDAEWWGGVCAEDFSAALSAIEGHATVRIDSPGGDVFGGRAIAQAIKEHVGGVTVCVDGLAASAASYIAIAADTVKMAEGSFFMVHKAWGMTIGNADDLRRSADLFDKIDDSIAASYAQRAGGDKDEWLSKMEAETWLSAEESLEAGLANAMIESAESPAENRVNWDISAFENAPSTETTDFEAAGIAAAAEISSRQRALTLALMGGTK